MGIHRSVDISCSSRGPGKMASICSALTTLPSGPSGGEGGLGRSATTLYQWVGISCCSSAKRVVCMVGSWSSAGGSSSICLLYTSDAADEEDSVDLGGRRI